MGINTFMVDVADKNIDITSRFMRSGRYWKSMPPFSRRAVRCSSCEQILREKILIESIAPTAGPGSNIADARSMNHLAYQKIEDVLSRLGYDVEIMDGASTTGKSPVAV